MFFPERTMFLFYTLPALPFLVLFLLLLWVERRAADPILPLRLFRERAVSVLPGRTRPLKPMTRPWSSQIGNIRRPRKRS